MHVLRLFAFWAAFVITGCGTVPGALPRPEAGPPTAAEARAILAEVVARARAGDDAGFCELGGTACDATLQAAGRRAPAEPPFVALNVPMRDGRGAAESAEARLLVVCGATDDGRAYATEIAVVWRDGGLRAIEPIYWSGLRVSTAPGDGWPEPSPLAIPGRQDRPLTTEAAAIEPPRQPVVPSTPMC